jgi:hypothetical protein
MNFNKLQTSLMLQDFATVKIENNQFIIQGPEDKI